MANEKVKPTQRELVLAGTIEDLAKACEVAMESRVSIADTLESLAKIIRKTNYDSRSLIASESEELAQEYPELFSVEDGELVAADPEDSEPPSAYVQWVKVNKPTQEGEVHWVSPNMDKYDGGIYRIFRITPDHFVTGGLVYLEGLAWSFDPAWLTPLPDLPEGWRYLQPDELVGFGDQVCNIDTMGEPNKWWASRNFGRKQAGNVVYRRRIANDTPAEASAVTEPQPEAQEIQPGTKVKILHPECLGRTGTTSWKNCPTPNCLLVWVESEDPVLRVGAIPIHKRYLAPLT